MNGETGFNAEQLFGFYWFCHGPYFMMRVWALTITLTLTKGQKWNQFCHTPNYSQK